MDWEWMGDGPWCLWNCKSKAGRLYPGGDSCPVVRRLCTVRSSRCDCPWCKREAVLCDGGWLHKDWGIKAWYDFQKRDWGRGFNTLRSIPRLWWFRPGVAFGNSPGYGGQTDCSGTMGVRRKRSTLDWPYHAGRLYSPGNKSTNKGRLCDGGGCGSHHIGNRWSTRLCNGRWSYSGRGFKAGLPDRGCDG